MKRHHLAVLAIVLAAPLSSRLAGAQDPDTDRATARALGHEGKEALARKDYSRARDRFSRAHALVAAPTLLLGLGRAELGLGRLVAADDVFRRIVREGAAPGSPAQFFAAIDEARAELAAVGPRLAWITLVVEGPDAPEVTIDGGRVPAAALGVRRPLDPGKHVVRAEASGFAPRETTVSPSEGEGSVLVLRLDPALAVGPLLPPARSGPYGRQRTLGLVSLGVGGVSFWTGVISGAVAVARHRSLASVCPAGVCLPGHEAGDVAGYQTVADLSTGTLVVGGAAAAAGLILLVTAPKTHAPVAPAIGLGTVAVTGSF